MLCFFDRNIYVRTDVGMYVGLSEKSEISFCSDRDPPNEEAPKKRLPHQDQASILRSVVPNIAHNAPSRARPFEKHPPWVP